jgi:hypothetical protein
MSEQKVEVDLGCASMLILVGMAIALGTLLITMLGRISSDLRTLNSTVEKCLIVPADAGSEEEK